MNSEQGDGRRAELMMVITNAGQGTKFLQAAKKRGVSGGTVLLGRGTCTSRLLNFLDLTEERKELVLMVAKLELAQTLLPELAAGFKFDKPNHGVGFSVPLSGVFGIQKCPGGYDFTTEGMKKGVYQCIIAIVEEGRAEDAVDAAVKAGSRGATILQGRGSGAHETAKLFAMDIEPEKEIVLILSKQERVHAIVDAIRAELKIDDPGRGIIFVMDVTQTVGLVE